MNIKFLSAVFLFILYVFTGHITCAQEMDLVYKSDGTQMEGKLHGSVLGATPEDALPMVINNSVQKIPLEGVTRIVYNGVTYVPIKIKVGIETTTTFANQYYFGRVNLYEARAKGLGTVQLIEREGRVQPLIGENFRGLLKAYLEPCVTDDDLAKTRLMSMDLIDLLDKYHDCSNLDGEARRLKEVKSRQLFLDVGLGSGFLGSVRFIANKNILQRTDLESGNGLEDSNWDVSHSGVLSAAVYVQSSLIRFGPIVRYTGFGFSTDNYNVGPYDDRNVYSEFTFNVQNIDGGISLGLQPTNYRKFNPYFTAAAFYTLSSKFEYDETKYASATNVNDPITVRHEHRTSYLAAVGTTFRNFAVELGMHVTQGSLFLSGPVFRSVLRGNTVTGHDDAKYDLLQLYLTLNYRLPVGKPMVRKVYH